MTRHPAVVLSNSKPPSEPLAADRCYLLKRLFKVSKRELHSHAPLVEWLIASENNTISLKMASQISKKRKFVADGVFRAELNEFFTRELAEEGYSGCDVRVTHARTEV